MQVSLQNETKLLDTIMLVSLPKMDVLVRLLIGEQIIKETDMTYIFYSVIHSQLYMTYMGKEFVRLP